MKKKKMTNKTLKEPGKNTIDAKETQHEDKNSTINPRNTPAKQGKQKTGGESEQSQSKSQQSQRGEAAVDQGLT